MTLPAGWARRSIFPLVHLLGLWWIIKYLLLKVPEETHVWGEAHNDPARVRETCRAYIYSEADKFVDHRAVEEHADNAEKVGYLVVRRDKFPDSQHVAHARSDPERYWSVVKDTWEASHQVNGAGSQAMQQAIHQGGTESKKQLSGVLKQLQKKGSKEVDVLRRCEVGI